MNKQEIEKYLGMVGLELQKQGKTLEILLLGGAVMLIEVGNRGDTDDVDTYHLPDYLAITKAAAVVAERESLKDSWLSSAAAGFSYFFIRQPDRKLWKKFPGLHVYTASLDYIFVSKLLAHRDKDEEDVTALVNRLRLSKQNDVFALLEKYVPKDAIPKDVWDEIEERFEP